MNQINWDEYDLDGDTDRAGKIAEAVVNFADCIEIFLPFEKAKSSSDPRALVPNAMFGPHTVYNAAIPVEQLINPMQEERGCVTGTLRVFAPTWAIRQELWRLYALQGWNDIPTKQLLIGPGTAITSMPLPVIYISGMSQRFRLLARLLVHAVDIPSPPTNPNIKDVPPKALKVMAEATIEVSLERKAIAIFVMHPGWKKSRIAEELRCHPRSLAKGRAPKLHLAIEAFESCEPPPHGTKSSDGTTEAWEYPFEDG